MGQAPEGFQSGSGNIRTLFVFTDFPKHVEFRAGELPLLEKGLEVEFDFQIKNPLDSKKPWTVKGIYKITQRILRYSTKRAGLMGMTQYLEWTPE